MFTRMLERNPGMSKYKSWAEIPDELKYNYDEEVGARVRFSLSAA